jgi:protocatechuate 4,5-dioxygenase, alpha chain
MASRAAIDVPATYVFDAEQSRRGYHLNKLCMSLRTTQNRAAFRRDEAAYCDAYRLTAEQAQAVLDRDWVRMLDLGGNIFCIFKLALVDERSMQFLGGAFSGLTEEQFMAMMAAGGRTDG